MTIKEIDRKIEQVKAAYREGQVLRKHGSLSEFQRKVNNEDQIKRVERLAALDSLRNPRAPWN